MLILMSAVATAAPVKIVQTGSGSGTLAAVPFPSSNFTITALADTSNRAAHSQGWYIDDTSASIAIDGLGTLDFLTGTRMFVNNAYTIVGFSRAGLYGADLFNGPTSAVFSTWDMLTPIGPIAGEGRLMQWTSSPVNTSGGILVFNDGISNATFVAIPEPATLALFGVLGIMLLRRR